MGASTYENFSLTKDPRERITFVSQGSTVRCILCILLYWQSSWMLKEALNHMKIMWFYKAANEPFIRKFPLLFSFPSLLASHDFCIKITINMPLLHWTGWCWEISQASEKNACVWPRWVWCLALHHELQLHTALNESFETLPFQLLNVYGGNETHSYRSSGNSFPYHYFLFYQHVSYLLILKAGRAFVSHHRLHFIIQLTWHSWNVETCPVRNSINEYYSLGLKKMKEKRFELKYSGNNFFLMLNFLVSTTTMLQRGSCFLMTLSLCHDSEMAVQILCLQWTASNGGRKKQKQKGTLGCAKDMK